MAMLTEKVRFGNGILVKMLVRKQKNVNWIITVETVLESHGTSNWDASKKQNSKLTIYIHSWFRFSITDTECNLKERFICERDPLNWGSVCLYILISRLFKYPVGNDLWIWRVPMCGQLIQLKEQKVKILIWCSKMKIFMYNVAK